MTRRTRTRKTRHFQTRGFSNTRLFDEQKRAINDVFRLLRSRQQAVAARAAADAALREAALLQAEQEAAQEAAAAAAAEAALMRAEQDSETNGLSQACFITASFGIIEKL